MKHILLLISMIMAPLGTNAKPFHGPRQVVLIRHGEKDVPETSPHLNERGFQRANALPRFLLNNPQIIANGPIAAIYAMKPKDADGSVRPIETVTPTASALKLTIHSEFTKKQIQELVTSVNASPDTQGRTVLICWEHKMIPLIAEAFGAVSSPKDWDGDRYDRAWILIFSDDGQIQFKDIGEQLLPGDTP